MKPRKSRSDSASARVKAFADASLPLIPPPSFIKLSKPERELWDSLIAIRPREAWTASDLASLGNLVHSQCAIEKLHHRSGTEAQIERLTKRALRLTQQLQLHPIATTGRSAKQAERSQLAREAHEALFGMAVDALPDDETKGAVVGDDLIARLR